MYGTSIWKHSYIKQHLCLLAHVITDRQLIISRTENTRSYKKEKVTKVVFFL